MKPFDSLENWISEKRKEGPEPGFSDRVMESLVHESYYAVTVKRRGITLFLSRMRYAAAIFLLMIFGAGLTRTVMILGFLLGNPEKGF